jgi:hypothetical protein
MGVGLRNVFALDVRTEGFHFDKSSILTVANNPKVLATFVGTILRLVAGSGEDDVQGFDNEVLERLRRETPEQKPEPSEVGGLAVELVHPSLMLFDLV